MLSQIFSSKSTLVDKFGVFAAVTCIIHCISLPLLGLLLITDSFFFQDEAFHVVLAVITVILMSASMIKGYSSCKNKKVFFMGVIGAVLICGNLLTHGHEGQHADEHLMDLLLEEAATILGGLFVILYHASTLSAHKAQNQA